MVDVAESIACLGVIVDAKDEGAEGFYFKYDFVTIEGDGWPSEDVLADRDGEGGGRCRGGIEVNEDRAVMSACVAGWGGWVALRLLLLPLVILSLGCASTVDCDINTTAGDLAGAGAAFCGGHYQVCGMLCSDCGDPDPLPFER